MSILRLAYVLVVVVLAPVAGSSARQAELLYVHLPRSALADGQTLTLRSIAALHGPAQLVQKAGRIAMGRAPWSGERITIDRATILSRLGSQGLTVDRVVISGADKVVVTRDEQQIPIERLISCARTLLQKIRPGPNGCSWRLAVAPEPLYVPSGVQVTLTAELPDDKPGDYVRVGVLARGEGRTVGRTTLLFKTVYPVRRAVAKKDIPAGQMITPENAEMKFFYAENPAGSDESPYGLLARNTIRAGSVIHRAMLRFRHRAVVVRRNQTVTMRITGAGFVVAALGKALQDGKCDEVIRVSNVDTGRVVRAKVLADGSVEPVISGPGATERGSGSPEAVLAPANVSFGRR